MLLKSIVIHAFFYTLIIQKNNNKKRKKKREVSPRVLKVSGCHYLDYGFWYLVFHFVVKEQKMTFEKQNYIIEESGR